LVERLIALKDLCCRETLTKAAMLQPPNLNPRKHKAHSRNYNDYKATHGLIRYKYMDGHHEQYSRTMRTMKNILSMMYLCERGSVFDE
jgi:hypothetical protein